MSELFEVPEMVRVAVEDERTGVVIYTALAASTKGAEVRGLFGRLVGQEKYHQMRFEAILEQMGGHSPREQYEGEYVAYLQTLTSTRAFPTPAAAVEAAQRCATDAAAVDLALQYERDTLALIHELRELVGPKHKDVVEDIAREERAHIVALADARRKMPA